MNPSIQYQKQRLCISWIHWVSGYLQLQSLIYTSIGDRIPTEVPIYLGLKGDIHPYGAKWELLLFPFITLLIGIALRFLEKHPKWHYFPLNITDPHIEKEVKQSVMMLSFIKNMSCLLLAIVVWETIHIAQGE